MLTIVQGSKWQAETISIVISFADELSSGDSITDTPVVSIVVNSGFDSNPGNLLYQGCTVTNGNTVEQRIRLGIPGVIYIVTFAVVTVAGDKFEKESYLAILPDPDSAVPNWLPLWSLTTLYPYQSGPDWIRASTVPTGGRLAQTVIPFGPDWINSFLSIDGGTLTGSGVTYVIPYEDLQSNAIIIGGTLIFVNTITYNYSHEDIKTNLAILGGTLIQAGLSYVIPSDNIQTAITLQNGTLV